MAEPAELRGYLGPFPILGTLIDDDRKEIERQTGVRASLRAPRKGHSAGQARHLSFNGPPERLREACKMAMVMIEKHGRTGGRKTTEQQRQEQQKAIVKRVSDAELELAKAKLKMEHTCGSSRPSASSSADCEPKKIDVPSEPKKIDVPSRLEPSDEPKKVVSAAFHHQPRSPQSSTPVQPEEANNVNSDEFTAFEPPVISDPENDSVTEKGSDTEPLTEPGRPSDTFSMRPPLPYPIGYGGVLPLQPSGSWWTGDFLEPVQYSNGEWNHALAQAWPAWDLW